MSDKPEDESKEALDKPASMNPLHVISSVFAAGLGVQSSKNRERDFKQGNFKMFVITGIAFTLLFIGMVFAVVTMVLKSAGA